MEKELKIQVCKQMLEEWASYDRETPDFNIIRYNDTLELTPTDDSNILLIDVVARKVMSFNPALTVGVLSNGKIYLHVTFY